MSVISSFSNFILKILLIFGFCFIIMKNYFLKEILNTHIQAFVEMLIIL
jgi:hypothetical protein